MNIKTKKKHLLGNKNTQIGILLYTRIECLTTEIFIFFIQCFFVKKYW